jgi:hypothetical protein
MTIQRSSFRNATLVLVAGAFAVSACSSSTDGGPATPGNDSGTGGGDATAMDDGSTGSDGGTVTDTGSSTDSAPQMDSALKPFGATCAGNGECTSNVCFMGGMGSYCSLHCTQATAATDCPVPPTSGQCNGMMFCKK